MDSAQFSSAEAAYLRRTRRVRVLFDRGRDLTTPIIEELLETLPQDDENFQAACEATKRLAALSARSDEYNRAREIAAGGAHEAHSSEQEDLAEQQGLEYPRLDGPAFDLWLRLWDRLAAWGGALAVEDLLSNDDLAVLELPGYLDDSPWLALWEADRASPHPMSPAVRDAGQIDGQRAV